MNWSDYFTCDPSLGVLRWRPRGVEHFKTDHHHRTWNTRFAEKIVGKKARLPNGSQMYLLARLGTKAYFVHRIIYEMMNGPRPKGMCIDHINGDRWDNRVQNLRLVTFSQNVMNKCMQVNNSTGVVGVYDRGSSWEAKIMVGKREFYLGRFKNKEDAIRARQEGERKYHGRYAASASRSCSAFADSFDAYTS